MPIEIGTMGLQPDVIQKYNLSTNPDGTVGYRTVNGAIVFMDLHGKDVYLSEIARREVLAEVDGRAGLLEADMQKMPGTSVGTSQPGYGSSGPTVSGTKSGPGPFCRKFFRDVLEEPVPSRLLEEPGASPPRKKGELTPYQLAELEKGRDGNFPC